MKIRKKRARSNSPSRTFGESLEAFLKKASATSAGAIGRGTLMGALMLGPTLPACTGDSDTPGEEAVEDDVPGLGGKADWAEDQGERNTNLVAYMGSYWHEYVNCYERGGCQGIDVFIKVRVKPIEGAILNDKRVGVVVQSPNDHGQFETVTGKYFSTHNDGFEEWHVPVQRRHYETGAFTFNAWYQDGLGNTYFDDNQGEFHAIAYNGIYSVLRHDWGNTSIELKEGGVSGKLSIVLADLDFDKDIRLVWTTDSWDTINESTIADAAETNGFHWVEDMWAGYERWEMNLDIQADTDAFEYAVLYKHGVKNDAINYDFWDNNHGQNYVVRRAE